MILCLGTTPVYQRSMIFERVTLDAVNRATEVRDYASGKSINVARVAHSLGAQVLATGFVGGSRGELLCRDLDAAGIRHDFVPVAPETRQCITVIDRDRGTATELVEESSLISQDAWDELDLKLRSMLPRAKAWVFSGTLAPGAPEDFYARWLPLARDLGAVTIIDARGGPLRRAMQHPNGILKLNREELGATFQGDFSTEDRIVQAIVEHAPVQGLLIVTLGSAGAIVGNRKECWRVTPPKVQAISAVGSGDAFAAGLAIALLDGRPLRDGLKLAAACGAANAMTPLAGHLDQLNIEQLLAQAKVDKTL